jgi:hypothetical protein
MADPRDELKSLTAQTHGRDLSSDEKNAFLKLIGAAFKAFYRAGETFQDALRKTEEILAQKE